MSATLDLNLVRLFADIVEAQGFAEAARRLGISRSAASRGLQQLERSLGSQLLHRTTRRLEPTSAGQVFLEHAQNMLREAEAARASVEGLGRTLRGHLRVSVPTGLGRMLLGPVLLDFAKAHPQVTLRVAFSNRVPDLVGAQIDIAIRIIDEPPVDYVARRLGDVPWRLCASPAYLAGRTIRRPEDLLAGHDLVAPPPTDGRRYPLMLARGAEPPETIALVPRIASEDFNFLLAAMLAGTGFGALPGYAVADALRSGRLVEVLPDHALRGLPDRVFALTTSSRYRPAAARALLDWVEEGLPPAGHRPAACHRADAEAGRLGGGDRGGRGAQGAAIALPGGDGSRQELHLVAGEVRGADRRPGDGQDGKGKGTWRSERLFGNGCDMQ